MKRAFILFVLITGLGAVQAETRYVTDQFKITLRSGESAQHKILRMLPSGTPVVVLGDNKQTGYTHVQTEDGREGYILSRQLLRVPIARDRLADAEVRLQELQQAPEKLSSKLATLQVEHKKLQTANNELSTLKNRLEAELEGIRRTASNAVRIANERNDLRKTVAELTRQVEDLNQENRELSNKTAQNWFLIGAGVIVAGIILGLILPHLRFQRRKSSWGSL